MARDAVSWGYARVSTVKRKGRHNQRPENQVERLTGAGIDRKRIFVDRASGKKASRPDWDRLLAKVKPGDKIFFTKLDRIGRSVPNLLAVVKQLDAMDVELHSLDLGPLSTKTPFGKLFFTILAALAEFELDLAQERIFEGMDALREANGGELPKRGDAITPDQLALARKLRAEGAPLADALAQTGMSKASYYRKTAA